MKKNERLDHEENLVMVGLTRIACEDIYSMHDLAENLGGNGESIDFDEVRNLSEELQLCADAADRCKAVYAAVRGESGKRNGRKEAKGNGKRRS